MFNICPNGDLSSPLDVAVFIQDLMGNWMGVVQYNDELGNPIDISYLCNIMEKSPSNPLAAYVNISNLFLSGPCLDISYQDMLEELINTTQVTTGVGNRQWTYQTCTQFGFFQTTDSPNQPFGDLSPLSFSLKICNDSFGYLPTAQLINDTNVYYGGKDLAAGPTNILFVNGNIDPWHALGVTTNLTDNLNAILINGTAHCANMFPAAPGQTALHDAQVEIANWIDNQLYALANAKAKV